MVRNQGNVHVQISRRERVSKSLQLGLALGLLEDGFHLRSLHDVTLDLELATHEQTLSVGLASNEGSEIGIGEGESDCAEEKELVRLPFFVFVW